MKYTARNGPQITLDSQLFRLWDKFLGLYKEDKKWLSNKKKKGYTGMWPLRIFQCVYIVYKYLLY